ncbi:MAG: hypothetical protein KC503_18495 [Myxococcales bacterium]|nr:hypothetical protein [Myxococcales bacterium]
MLSGCDSSSTALLITLKGLKGVQPAETLAVTVTQTDSLTLNLTPNTGGRTFFGRAGPETARLVIQADGRQGQATVDVIARGSDGRGVGSGRTLATLIADTVVQASMQLAPYDFEANNGATSKYNEFFSTGPSGRQLGSGASGRFVIAWRNDCVTPPCSIYSRLFDDYGVPQLRSDGSSDEFIASDPAKSYDMPAVAMQPGGDFVYLFKRVAGNLGGPGDIVARSYDPNGQARSGDVPLSAGTMDTSAPDIAALPAGGYVVVWEQERKPGSTVMVEVAMKLLDTQGNPQPGSDRLVASFNKLNITGSQCSPPGDTCPDGAECSGNLCVPAGATPAVAAGTQPGTVMVVWRQQGELMARAYNNNQDLGAAQPVSTGTSKKIGGIDVAAVATGYAVVFDDLPGGTVDNDQRAIWLRRFSLSGKALDSDFTLNESPQGNQTNPVIATSLRQNQPNVSLVVWNSSVSDGDPAGGLRGRGLLLNGMPVGRDFAINSTTNNAQQNPSIAPHGDESFIVAFEDSSAQGLDKLGSAIRARIVYPSYSARDGLIGALCDAQSPCAADLECAPTQVGSRCTVATNCTLGNPCPTGGTCQNISNVARPVCVFAQP